MKTTNNPLYAKIRLFLIVLTSCIIATCIFLVIIHPEVWIAPTCIIIVMLAILLYLLSGKRKKCKSRPATFAGLLLFVTAVLLLAGNVRQSDFPYLYEYCLLYERM